MSQPGEVSFIEAFCSRLAEVPVLYSEQYLPSEVCLSSILVLLQRSPKLELTNAE